MTDSEWLRPLDLRIQQVKEETEQIKRENAAMSALLKLYSANNDGLERLAKKRWT